MSNKYYTIAKKCKLSQGFLPSFTPEIYNLSVDTSTSGVYTNVFVIGKNFLPNGTSYINFGTNTIAENAMSFYNSNVLSFVVPANAEAGTYSVVVVNNYNSNFGSLITTFYNGNLNFSNSKTYTIQAVLQS